MLRGTELERADEPWVQWLEVCGDAPRPVNDAAQERLHARLHTLGLAFHPALGCNSQGGMVEHGCLVLDPSTEQADALARELGQGGTLFWHADAPVRLRMMWTRPPQADDDPHTDWVG